MDIQLINAEGLSDRYTKHGASRLLHRALSTFLNTGFTLKEAMTLAEGRKIKKLKVKFTKMTSIEDTVYKGKYIINFDVYENDFPSYVKGGVETISLVIW